MKKFPFIDMSLLFAFILSSIFLCSEKVFAVSVTNVTRGPCYELMNAGKFRFSEATKFTGAFDRKIGESSDAYLARLKNYLSKMGGAEEVIAIEKRKPLWDAKIVEKFKSTDPEVTIPQLRRNDERILSEAEYLKLEKEFLQKRPIYIAMMEFFNSPRDLYIALKQFELMVRLEMKIQNLTYRDALEVTLRKIEKENGFSKPLDLPQEIIPLEEVLTYVYSRHPIRDVFFEGYTRKQWHHGVDTHRIQFAAISLDMMNNPGRYSKSKEPLPSLADLYAFTGNPLLLGRLVFSRETKFPSLFDAFDNRTFQTPTNPELVRELYQVGIGGVNSIP